MPATRIEDPKLVEELEAKNVKFTGELVSRWLPEILGWVIPLLLATAIIGVIGVIMQQVFLRWTQGQDLRQALITIALSVILADQMLAAFGGISKDIKTPTDWPDSINIFDVRFGFFRGPSHYTSRNRHTVFF